MKDHILDCKVDNLVNGIDILERRTDKQTKILLLHNVISVFSQFDGHSVGDIIANCATDARALCSNNTMDDPFQTSNRLGITMKSVLLGVHTSTYIYPILATLTNIRGKHATPEVNNYEQNSIHSAICTRVDHNVSLHWAPITQLPLANGSIRPEMRKS